MAERISLTREEILMIRAIPLSPELQAKGEALLEKMAKRLLDEELDRMRANG